MGDPDADRVAGALGLKRAALSWRYVKGVKEGDVDRLLDRLIVAAFWTMSVICLVNLNDFARMLFGVERLFSGLLLVCCLVVLTGLLRVRPLEALGASGVLILATLASYVGIGMAMDIVNGNDSRWEAVSYLVRHLQSILLILATAVGARAVWNRIGGERLMKGILLVMVATCALVVASPWLIEIYVVQPFDLGGRFYGSFSNPNEVALVCGFAAALSLAFLRTGRAPLLAGGGLALALTALALTFSRTVWLAMPVVLAHALLASRPRERRRLAGALVLAGVLAAPPAVSLGAESLQDPYGLMRMEQLLQAFRADSLDDIPLGGRDIFWRLGAEKVVEAPLVGNGLGRLHRLEDTWFNAESGKYFGAHNEYLVLWGEAGIIPLVLFVVFLGTLLASRPGPRARPAASRRRRLLDRDRGDLRRDCSRGAGAAGLLLHSRPVVRGGGGFYESGGEAGCSGNSDGTRSGSAAVASRAGAAAGTDVSRKLRAAISSGVIPAKRAACARRRRA